MRPEEEMMRYDDERFGFDGEARDVDGYFTRENFVAMFGACDLTDDEMAALREQAHRDLNPFWIDVSQADDVVRLVRLLRAMR